MQTQINVDSAIKAAGASVGVTWDGTRMVVTSKSYGAMSQMEITANTTSLINVGVGISGLDIAGSIGGVTPTQGVLTGSTAPTSLTISPVNNSFAINVDGAQSGAIALTQQTYTSYDDMAKEMQTQINADSTLKTSGASVGVSYDAANNRMIVKSNRYGADSQVIITANTTTLGLSVGAGISGVGPSGKGQELTSTTGDSQGLKLIIGDNLSGNKGTVDFSRGLMEQLDSLMTGLLNSTTGSFTTRTNSLQKGLTNIATDRTKLATRMAALQTSLLARFNKMDALVGQMQSTSTYLTQQFKSTTSTN
jgi:flagellar hook-associated protein 2